MAQWQAKRDQAHATARDRAAALHTATALGDEEADALTKRAAARMPLLDISSAWTSQRELAQAGMNRIVADLEQVQKLPCEPERLLKHRMVAVGGAIGRLGRLRCSVSDARSRLRRLRAPHSSLGFVWCWRWGAGGGVL